MDLSYRDLRFMVSLIVNFFSINVYLKHQNINNLSIIFVIKLINSLQFKI